ncbi:MAG: VWA domain-containing protein, partial [Gemmataceae bacterium]
DVEVEKDKTAKVQIQSGIELAGRSDKETPFIWQVQESKTKKEIVTSRNGWNFQPLPPGNYTVSLTWHVGQERVFFTDVEVEKDKAAKVAIQSGIELIAGAAKEAPYSWQVRNSETKTVIVQSTDGWGFQPLPPGKYSVSLTLKFGGGRITYAEEVLEGKVVVLRFPSIAERLARVSGTGLKTEKMRDPVGYKKLEEEIEKSIRRGAQWLKKQPLFNSPLDLSGEYQTIGILALLHAGEFERDPVLGERCADYLLRRPLHTRAGTYTTALTAMALGDWDRQAYSQRVLECAQWLVENQGWNEENKVWSYGSKVPGIGDEKKTPSTETTAALEVVRRGSIVNPSNLWDNSCSQFAVLGLHSAAQAGIKIPRESWERVEKHFRGVQDASGGWGYDSGGGYGSMTCSGLASSLIARHYLGRDKSQPDLSVLGGLEWLAENFTVENNPHSNSHHYYYLFGLERVGVLAGTEFLGDNEWYPIGARYLLAKQNGDGSWTAKYGDANQYLDTCYAILFLRRATLSFEPKLTVKITQPTAGKWVRGAGEIISVPRSSPSHPVTGVDFYLDGKKLGTVAESPFKIPVDFGQQIKAHEIRVVAHNTAGQEATDKVTTPATFKNATLSVFDSGAGLPPELVPTVELLLDCSGSMVDPVEGQPKYQTARRVVQQTLDELPDHFQVGFRAFGHMGFWRGKPGKPADDDPNWNTDSELLISIGRLGEENRRRLIKDWINYLKPAGATPLVYSLLQAHKDLSAGWPGPKMVVVVSDGMETCGGKLEDVAKAYKKGSGVELAVHVVGFGVPADEEKRLKEIVKGAGGKYYDARTADQLAGALRQAIKSAYLVLDENGKAEVARGQVNGTPLSLPPARYQVQLVGAKTKPLAIEIQDGQRLNLVLDKNGLQPQKKIEIRYGSPGQPQDPKNTTKN